MHSGIDFAISKQCHKGLRDEIGAGRKESLRKKRHLRNEVSRFYQDALTDNPLKSIVTVNQIAACGVMIF